MKLLIIYIFTFPLFLLAQPSELPKVVDLEKLSIETLSAKTDTLAAQGKYKELINYFLVLEKKVKTKFGNTSEEFISISSNLAVTFEGLGNFEKAEIYYKKTLDLILDFSGENSANYIINLTYYGDFLKVKGNKIEAQKYLLQAYEASKKNKDQFEDLSDYLAPMGFLGNFYRDNGEYEKALPLYLEQKGIYENEIGEQHPEYGANLSNLATLYDNIGQKEKALNLNKKAVAVTEKYMGTDNFAYGQRVNNLALNYSGFEDYMTSDSLYQISLKNAENLFGKSHREYALRLHNLGVNNIRLGNYLLAKTQIEEARLVLLKKYPKYHKRILDSTYSYAVALAKNEQKQEAIKLLMDAVQPEEKNKHANLNSVNIGNFIDAGWLFEVKRYEEVSKKYYLLAIKNKLNTLKNKFEYYSENEQLKYAKSLQKEFDRFESYSFRNPENQDFITQCLNNKIIKKGLLLANNNRLAKAMQSKTNKNIQKEYREWQALKANLAKEYGLPPSRRAEDFVAQVEKVETLEGRLSRESVSFKKTHQFTGYTEIAQHLKAGEIAIEFSSFQLYPFASQEASDSILYVAYLIKNGLEVPIMIPLFEEKALPNLKHTKKLYQHGADKKNSLFHLIWNKLAPEMEGIHTIYYSPVGLLNSINFSAIPINESETIADRFRLYAIGSTRQLVFPHEISNYEQMDAIIFGGIDYEQDTIEVLAQKTKLFDSENETLAARSLSKNFRSYGGKSWNYLEWTKKEAENVTAILQSTNVSVALKKGKSASEAFFKTIGKNQPSPRILHLATHGYFFPKPKKDGKTGFSASTHPLIRSGLILAGANLVWEGNQAKLEEEDGILTAYEISQMDLSNTELVVLSACETALGDIKNEGVYGLQRAFKTAGVKYVLMSLWSVKDKQTYEFMIRFYELYQIEKKSIPEAYQMAQNEMRQQYTKPFNPRLWAGFVLVE